MAAKIGKIGEAELLARYPAALVGRVIADRSRRTLRRADGRVEALEVPEQDPFWPAFFPGLGKP